MAREGQSSSSSSSSSLHSSLSSLGGWKPGSKVLDVGCGIGGPYRNIARFTGWNITGITLNEHQVQRGNSLNKSQGLAGQCQSVQGDFMKLPFPDAYRKSALFRIALPREPLRALNRQHWKICRFRLRTSDREPRVRSHAIAAISRTTRGLSPRSFSGRV